MTKLLRLKEAVQTMRRHGTLEGGMLVQAGNNPHKEPYLYKNNIGVSTEDTTGKKKGAKK